ncbi:hypothetical protein DM01DRAFT_1406480 [Hesseltinella vesiculosa]|uniref:SAP domain-containing protein n=1 Tax=Hesseltinella vesiculosa TaxID=101127 RepID=A0A1X2GML8_9FUNG|nr:hypothetical protein DM01DRAFT_1406480 [Hesseltinella vesiculosa]
MSEKYKALKVKDLQELLQKNDLPHAGKKEELIERLVKHDEQKAQELANLEAELGTLDDFDGTNLDDLADSEFQSLTEKKPAESTSKPSTATTEPEKQQDPAVPATKDGSSFSFTPVVFEKKAAPPSNAQADVQRKIDRAKRFNVPLDEKTKQKIRAERFNTGQPKQQPQPQQQNKQQQKNKPQQRGKKPVVKSASSGVDPEVLRKRAERFNIPIPSKVLDEEKKRQRAERFGASKKPKTA